jgi:hypothetical protein
VRGCFAATERKIIVDSISEAHALVNDEYPDPPTAAEAVRNLLEGNRIQAEADAQRLVALIRDVANHIGEAPVGFNENATLHAWFEVKEAAN